MDIYPEEVLDEEDDDGTMPENVDTLREAVVGRKIVSAEKAKGKNYWGHPSDVFRITLDDGRIVELADTDDCCAYTELREFMTHVDQIDHVITGVGTTDGYTTWHIYADLGDVMEMKVGWSSGNPFYYGYGFDIKVIDPKKEEENGETV